MTFKEEQSQKVQMIATILSSYLPDLEDQQQVIVEAMKYSLLAGGKRLRPMLMKETFDLFGGQGGAIEPLMAAQEMIHTYSLVHDDLPAMDDDEYRRGRKTTHVVYGEDLGILAGDALLNYAFETAAKGFDLCETMEDYKRVARAIRILGEKAGIFGMIGGQVVDVTSDVTSMEQVDFIYRLKTGALIESSMMIGAVLAGASDEDVNRTEQVAAKVGMAFQIQDDILDITGSQEKLGKPIHSDEKNEKVTYVTLQGLEKAKEDVTRLSEEAVAILKQLPGENEFLETLLLSLINRES